MGHEKIIYCPRSGVPLLKVETVCSQGWALLSNPAMDTMVHPIYGLALSNLCRRLDDQLAQAIDLGWELQQHQITEISLCMSAILYNLGVFGTAGPREPSLPDTKVTCGCAARLLDIASWYYNETSRRIAFPRWNPNKHSGNLNWHGFSGWLDACHDIREDWKSIARQRADQELLTSTTTALKLVSQAKVYKRIDVAKVWRWIELQAKDANDKYPAGRRETLKSLFISGEQSPELWIVDDCDDLIEMVLDTCDIGNDITSYIRDRVSNIRAAIHEFYGNFTLLGGSNPGAQGLELSESEQRAETTLLAPYAQKLASMTELPPKPNPADYPNRVAALKAQAEWNILSKLFRSVS